MPDAEHPDEPAAVPRRAGCPRHRAMQPLVSAVWWLIAAAGAVAVSALPLDVGEGMCGVWGCFPPFPAMLAMHLLWVVALGAAVHAVRRWKPTLLRPFGVLLFAVALTATVWIAGADLFRWLDRAPEQYHAFWPKRVGYTVATHIDLPLVQGLIAGVVAFALGRRKAGPCESMPRPTSPFHGVPR